MAPKIELERKVIKRSVTKSKRDRYLQFVTSTKNRQKFMADLYSGQFFLQGVLEEQVIRQALIHQDTTTGTCYVISENTALDTQTLTLPEALRTVVGWSAGTILVFGDADLVFVELNGLRNRYISKPNLLEL
jgi:hypothetical protein